MSVNFNRKSNRLPFAELYSGGYWYFVTICTDQKKNLFVEEPLRFQNQDQQKIVADQPIWFQNNRFELSKIGKEAERLLQKIPQLFSDIVLDEFVIMPNHIHAIIGFGKQVYYKNGIKEQSLSDVIGKFKSILWTDVKNDLEWNGKRSATIWQKSFYDHIIRDDEDLQRIREYIINNPLNWHLDSLNPQSSEHPTN
jgi:REP element-mobilizing transposase RayT